MSSAPRVLFVEDEEYRNARIPEMLRGAGLEVTVAGTLADAMRAVSEGDFNCVLLDVMLPPGDGEQDQTIALNAGVEFLGEVRAGNLPGVDPQIPVVVLTARVEPSVESKMRALGVHTFRNKPESIHEVVRAVRAALGLDQP